MEKPDGCQLVCLPNIAEGIAPLEPQSLIIKLKRHLARPWNYLVKRWLKWLLSHIKSLSTQLLNKGVQTMLEDPLNTLHLQVGDWVRVRSMDEIQITLGPFKELKGCAFLEDMKQYCGTNQKVFKVMERFLDERDYQVKKIRGIVLLEGVYCQGTPVFGRCDRSCLSFWREEWLEKIDHPEPG